MTSGPDTGKGLLTALADEQAAEVGRLTAEAAKTLGCDDASLEAAEAVIRAGMMTLGCGILGQLLAADPGYRGPRAGCGNGHEAVFISYRDKVIETVLGAVTVKRAWYHCAACGHGLAPRDAELGVTGAPVSPGLAVMNDPAAAAGPFAGAARLLEELAGVRLTAKRAGRAAEASGAAVAAAGRQRVASPVGSGRPDLIQGGETPYALCAKCLSGSKSWLRQRAGTTGEARPGKMTTHLRTQPARNRPRTSRQGQAEHKPVATSPASSRPPRQAHSQRATSCRNKFLIRDRAGQFTETFDAVLASPRGPRSPTGC